VKKKDKTPTGKQNKKSQSQNNVQNNLSNYCKLLHLILHISPAPSRICQVSAGTLAS